MFIGRDEELNTLNKAFKSKAGKIVCIYGRRRIGKSILIKEFIKRNKATAFVFEGLEKERSPEQIKHFKNRLSQQLKDKYIAKLDLKDWDEVFTLLTEKVINRKNKKEKLVIAFDELQWMAAKRTKLIALIKYFWDNHWCDSNVVLILCGSIASFMIDKVIYSKALYGRIDYEILLRQLKPNEAAKFFTNKRNKEEILKYLMIFGSVPKYLEIIDTKRSFKQNMEELCFNSEGFMVDEINKVFYSQFKETKNYQKIVELVQEKILSLQEIVDKLKIGSGGGLKTYLKNLENAQIITSYQAPQLITKSKNIKYKLSDEYLSFYFKYMKPNLRAIKKKGTRNLFSNLCENKWQSWLGFAFEKFINKNAMYCADLMGFGDLVIDYSPFYSRTSTKFQIDLVYLRADKTITVCEVKYHNKEIGTSVIPELKRKIELMPHPKGYTIDKALISLYGEDRSLIDSDYFDYSLCLNDIF